MDVQWIPLLEYAFRRGLSLSTVRRYIKCSRVEFRLDRGKYWIRDAAPRSREGDWSEKVQELESHLTRAREEIAEMKMLIAAYEDKLAQDLGRGRDLA